MTIADHKCGTVAIIGEPNAGKSSLINALVGDTVAITATLAGTTRQAIRGILNTDNAQIIFIDTPGMQPATNMLERQMNRAISGAVKSADVICFVIDVTNVNSRVLNKLANYQDFGVPVVLALTKIDRAQPAKILAALQRLQEFTFVKDFVPVSALKRQGLTDLIACLEKYLPTGSAIFERDVYTDSTERAMATEIIRGAVIHRTADEVPAGVKVVITEFTTVDRSIKIAADIICDKVNHKKIIVGAQGKMIRQIGIDARRELEKLLGRHVILSTFVIVREGWRDQVNWLRD